MAKVRTRRISPDINIRISLTKGRDGYVVAECLDVPGCISQGKTEAEALANVYDAVSTAFAMIVRNWIRDAKSGRAPAPIHAKQKELRLAFVRKTA